MTNEKDTKKITAKKEVNDGNKDKDSPDDVSAVITPSVLILLSETWLVNICVSPGFKV